MFFLVVRVLRCERTHTHTHTHVESSPLKYRWTHVRWFRWIESCQWSAVIFMFPASHYTIFETGLCDGFVLFCVYTLMLMKALHHTHWKSLTIWSNKFFLKWPRHSNYFSEEKLYFSRPVLTPFSDFDSTCCWCFFGWFVKGAGLWDQEQNWKASVGNALSVATETCVITVTWCSYGPLSLDCIFFSFSGNVQIKDPNKLFLSIPYNAVGGVFFFVH